MTWEEWVATQAELALTSSMANLNHTVWKLRETFVLNPKNEKKRRREYLYTMLLWAALALWCGVVVSFPNSKFPAFLGFSLSFSILFFFLCSLFPYGEKTVFVKHVWATNFLSGELLTLPVEPLVSRGIWKGNSDGLTLPQVCSFLFPKS